MWRAGKMIFCSDQLLAFTIFVCLKLGLKTQVEKCLLDKKDLNQKEFFLS